MRIFGSLTKEQKIHFKIAIILSIPHTRCVGPYLSSCAFTCLLTPLLPPGLAPLLQPKQHQSMEGSTSARIPPVNLVPFSPPHSSGFFFKFWGPSKWIHYQRSLLKPLPALTWSNGCHVCASEEKELMHIESGHILILLTFPVPFSGSITVPFYRWGDLGPIQCFIKQTSIECPLPGTEILTWDGSRRQEWKNRLFQLWRRVLWKAEKRDMLYLRA